MIKLSKNLKCYLEAYISSLYFDIFLVLSHHVAKVSADSEECIELVEYDTYF